MAGVPPTLGFYAKFTVLQAALQAGFLWLVVFAVLMAVIGAFYYLRVIKHMYFDEPQDNHSIEAPFDMRVALSVNALALLVIGLMPQGLMSICAYAVIRSLS
jgi:NADH-quinone oxidoreductase subunit N